MANTESIITDFYFLNKYYF